MELAEQALVAAASAPAEARAFVRATGGRWNVNVDDAVLVVSELVTNVVRHVGGRLRVCLRRNSDRLIIEVSDTSITPPSRQSPVLQETSGRGLLIVERLATAWGSRVNVDGGKTVWAELVV